MRYSTRLRNAVLRKVLPPESQNVSAVSAEFGISIQTIQRWMSAAQSGTIGHEDALVPPFRKPLAEKFEYVLEAARLSEVDKGKWLREQGIHEEHLTLWEQELRTTMAHKQQNQDAELAALLALKKKTRIDLGGRRGRLIREEDRQHVIALIDEAVAAGARRWKCCEVVGISMRTLQRWRAGLLTDRRKGAPKRVANKLEAEVIAEIIETACSPEYRNDTPYVMYVKLLEEQRYIASPRSMYRILKAQGVLKRRTNSAPPVKRNRPPERVATGPNQVWSWDITYLPLNIKGFFVYAYVFL